MTRSDLIAALQERNNEVAPEAIEKASKLIFDRMLTGLSEGDRVEIRGFGSFSLRRLKPHAARNPKTGKQVLVGNRFSIYFRPGKILKEKINTSAHK